MQPGIPSPAQLEAAAQARLSTDLGLQLGPFVIGMFVDAILFGVTLQLYIQWQIHHAMNETKWVKGLVYYLVIISITMTAYIIAWIFHVFVYNYGHFAQFLDLKWISWFSLLDNAARIPVSAFFAERAYRMRNRSTFLAITLGVLLFSSVAFAIAAKALVVYPTPAMQRHRKMLIYAWIGLEMISDLITTGCIAWSLFKSRTGWRATDKVITKLLVLVAETQLPPTILAVIYLIVNLAAFQTSLSAIFTCAAKVDCICLLVVLNTRSNLRSEAESQLNSRWKDNTFQLSLRGRQVDPPRINVTTETYIHSELPDSISPASANDTKLASLTESTHTLDYHGSDFGLTRTEVDLKDGMA